MILRKTLFIVLTTVLAFPLMAQVSFGQPEKINLNWKFIASDVENAQTVDFNDSRWRNVDLPHDWSVRGQLSPTLASATGYLPGGIGWYRKTLNVPAEKQGEKVYLYFEGVYNRSEVFINGQSVGQRPNGYISFMYDATPYIKYGEENTITVRVDHSRSADSRWYTGSGIYRNVWLVYANPIHIAQWGVYVYPKTVTNRNAVMSVEVALDNYTTQAGRLTVKNEIISPEGKTVATNSRKVNVPANGNNKINVDMKVSNPQLWSIDNPRLYKLRTTVTQNGKVIDQTETNTGIRTLTFDPNKGFALNGEWMKVKGVCIHHDAGVLGSAVPAKCGNVVYLHLKKLVATLCVPAITHRQLICTTCATNSVC